MLFKVTHTQTYTQEKAAVLGYKTAQRKLTTQRIHKHMFELSTGMLHIFCSVIQNMCSMPVHTTCLIHNLPAADTEHAWPVWPATEEHLGAALGVVGSY